MPKRIIKIGNVPIDDYIPYANHLLHIHKRYMELGRLNHLVNSVRLNDGTLIRLVSAGGIDNVMIRASEAVVIREEEVAEVEYGHGVWIWTGGSDGYVAAVHYENFATLLGQYVYTEVSQSPEIPSGIAHSQAVFIFGLARALLPGELSILNQLLANDGKIFFYMADNIKLGHQRTYIDAALDQLNSPMTIDSMHRNAIENFEWHDMPFGPGAGSWDTSISRWLHWETGPGFVIPSVDGSRILEFQLIVGDSETPPLPVKVSNYAIFPRCVNGVGRGVIDTERFPQIQTIEVDHQGRPIICDSIIPIYYGDALDWIRRCGTDVGEWPDPKNMGKFTDEEAAAIDAWSYLAAKFRGYTNWPRTFLNCEMAYYNNIYVSVSDCRYTFCDWFEIPRINQDRTVWLFWKWITAPPVYHTDWPFFLGPTYYVAGCNYADGQGWWIVPGPSYIPPVQE